MFWLCHQAQQLVCQPIDHSFSLSLHYTHTLLQSIDCNRYKYRILYKYLKSHFDTVLLHRLRVWRCRKEWQFSLVEFKANGDESLWLKALIKYFTSNDLIVSMNWEGNVGTMYEIFDYEGIYVAWSYQGLMIPDDTGILPLFKETLLEFFF